MKNIFLKLSIVIIIISSGCEGPRTYYEFKIVNNSSFLLNSKINFILKNETLNTTIDRKTEILIDGISGGYYKDYEDSLITHYFKEFEILNSGKKIKKDVFKKSNWKEHLKLEGIIWKEGECTYTITINDSDIE